MVPKGLGFNFDANIEIRLEHVAYLFGLGEGRLSKKATLESKSRLQSSPFFGPITIPELAPVIYGPCDKCHSAEIPFTLIFEDFIK